MTTVHRLSMEMNGIKRVVTLSPKEVELFITTGLIKQRIHDMRFFDI